MLAYAVNAPDCYCVLNKVDRRVWPKLSLLRDVQALYSGLYAPRIFPRNSAGEGVASREAGREGGGRRGEEGVSRSGEGGGGGAGGEGGGRREAGGGARRGEADRLRMNLDGVYVWEQVCAASQEFHTDVC